MKYLLIIAIVGFVIYFLIKLILFLYRPFYLAKRFNEIELLHNKVQDVCVKDLNMAIDTLEKWHSGNDVVIRVEHSADKLDSRIKSAQSAAEHEQEVYEKFIRLRERFIRNHQRLAESILNYKRYLEIRLKQNQNARLFASAPTSGVMNFEEFSATAKEQKIALEECEKKLDILLSEQAIF